LLPSSRTVWLLILVFVVEAALFFILFVSPGSVAERPHGLEVFVSLAIFHFVSLLYFIDEIDICRKGVVYGLFIPASYIAVLELTTYLAGILSMTELTYIVDVLLLAFYFEFLFFSICCILLLISMRSGRLSNSASKFWAICHCGREMDSRVKFIMVSALVYMIFMAIYPVIIMPDGSIIIQNVLYSRRSVTLSEKILNFIVPVYLISFMSLLVIFPLIKNSAKAIFLCCLAFPVAWSLLIKLAYAFLLVIITGGTGFGGDDIFQATFYFEYYIQSKAWFIGFPLLINFGYVRGCEK
jgi:hypothetical protein